MSDECLIVRRLGMQGRREELTAMNAWLESFVAASSLPPAAAYHLDLVLNEAVTKVIDYAGELAGELHIDIACALQGDIVTLEITDNGRAFDPTAWREAPPPASLDEAAYGLGAGPVRTFFDVTLPIISPAVASGLFFAFLVSFDNVPIDGLPDPVGRHHATAGHLLRHGPGPVAHPVRGGNDRHGRVHHPAVWLKA